MTYQDFKDELSSRLSQLLDENISIEFKEVKKNNGVILHGLLFNDRERNIAPTIYLDYFYDKYQNDALYSMDVICDDIMSQYRQYAPGEDFDVTLFTDFEKAKNMIGYKLINFEQNRDLLEEIPYVKFLDLAIVFYCMVKADFSGNGSILIRNEHINLWGVTAEDLLELARKNTPGLLGSQISSISDFLGNIAEEYDLPPESLAFLDTTPLYVLSNTVNLFGACCILYKNLLEKFSEELDSDLIIIPSSIHEVLLLKDDDIYDSDMLCELINHVNKTSLAAEDILSNHAYYYRRDSKMITY